MDYGRGLVQSCESQMMPQQLTVMERLKNRRDELQILLDKTKSAIEFLEKNPEMEQFMSCIRDVNCL